MLKQAVTGLRVTALMMNNLEENSNYNKLSIQVSLDGFSFYANNKERAIEPAKGYISFKEKHSPVSALEEISVFFNENPLFEAKYRDVEVVYSNELYTVVPASLFDKDNLTEYLKYNVKLLQTDFIAYDELEAHELVNIYIPYTNINNYFFERFGSFTYNHSASVLIDKVLNSSTDLAEPRLTAHFNESTFDLVIVKGEKLLLANTFAYHKPEDVLYYILFCIEQFSLNADKNMLHVAGNITQEDAKFALLYKYIRHIKIEERADDVFAHNSFLITT